MENLTRLLNTVGLVLLCAVCCWVDKDPPTLEIDKLKKRQAFQCYQCNSTTNVECLEQFPSEASLTGSTCNVADAQYCIKVTGVWGAVVGTYRFCSSRDLGNQCQYFGFDDHDRTYRGCVHTCYNNNCNGSGNLVGSIFMSVSIAAALFAWLRC